MLIRRISARRSVSIWAALPGGKISNAISKRRPDATVNGRRLEDRDDLQNRRKPSIELDQEPTVVVRPRRLAPQHNQLMSKRRILCLKPAV